MPKVLFVIARLNKGGTAQYVGELAEQLPRYGYQVLIATGYVQGQEIEDEITKKLPIKRIKNLGRKVDLIKDLKARNELKHLIDKFKPDLIYSHTFKAGAITRTIKTDIPIIHAFHGHLLDEPELAGAKVKIATTIEKRLASKAKYLVTVGAKVAVELLEEGVGRKYQYISIAPGVRPLKLESKSKARKALNLEKEKRTIIVWLARVVAVKGPDKVIELAKAIPGARFLIAGGGDQFEKIKAKAPENLTLVGWQPASRMWSVADIAISTSANEGMPIALIEAQLAGIPVIALNAGSVEEVIKDKKSGFIFDNLDENYISTLNKLLRIKLGRYGKRRAKKEFDPGRLVQDHLELFKKVI
jgi:glycosyltransferase involved in cell wall biosynthesis